MPRETRKLSYTGFYHVMVRGVNKEIIFKDEKDKKCFLRLLSYYKSRENCIIHAYCLMDNHVHILIQDMDNKLSDFMRNVTSVYAEEFNKKYKRVGHLFQERFKSECVEDDYYLKRLIRYIHRNPEKAGICKTEEYKWSSYMEYIEKNTIIQKDFVLSMYNKNPNLAIKEFKNNVLNGQEDTIDNVYLNKQVSNEDAICFINFILKVDSIDEIIKKNKKEIKEYVRRIKETRRISNKQIAEVLKLNKNFVGKIKVGFRGQSPKSY